MEHIGKGCQVQIIMLSRPSDQFPRASVSKVRNSIQRHGTDHLSTVSGDWPRAFPASGGFSAFEVTYEYNARRRLFPVSHGVCPRSIHYKKGLPGHLATT